MQISCLSWRKNLTFRRKWINWRFIKLSYCMETFFFNCCFHTFEKCIWMSDNSIWFSLYVERVIRFYWIIFVNEITFVDSIESNHIELLILFFFVDVMTWNPLDNCFLRSCSWISFIELYICHAYTYAYSSSLTSYIEMNSFQ